MYNCQSYFAPLNVPDIWLYLLLVSSGCKECHTVCHHEQFYVSTNLNTVILMKDQSQVLMMFPHSPLFCVVIKDYYYFSTNHNNILIFSCRLGQYSVNCEHCSKFITMIIVIIIHICNLTTMRLSCGCNNFTNDADLGLRTDICLHDWCWFVAWHRVNFWLVASGTLTSLVMTVSW